MLKFLIGLVTWMLSGLIARVLIWAGLTVITSVTLGALVESAMQDAIAGISGIASAALQLALLGGVADFFSIIGSALLTRAAIRAAMAGLGLKTGSSS